MSEVKFTPGPWAADADGGGWYICQPDGEQLAYISPPDAWEEPHFTEEQADANANLMAAAPELLAIVQRLDAAARESKNAVEFSNLCDLFIEDARAAIAKATA